MMNRISVFKLPHFSDSTDQIAQDQIALEEIIKVDLPSAAAHTEARLERSPVPFDFGS